MRSARPATVTASARARPPADGRGPRARGESSEESPAQPRDRRRRATHPAARRAPAAHRDRRDRACPRADYTASVPIYEYRCESGDERFEEYPASSETPSPPGPACGAARGARLYARISTELV